MVLISVHLRIYRVKFEVCSQGINTAQIYNKTHSNMHGDIPPPCAVSTEILQSVRFLDI